MTAAVRAFDGRISHTTLLESVQRELGLVHINDIVHRLYVTGMSRPEIAALAPVVIEAARVGDPVALALIQRGTQDLADCVLAVAKHLGMTAGVCELVLVGGLFRAGGIYIEPLQKAVLERLPHCHITLPELPPTLGACLLALQQLGITIDDAITRALRLSKKKLES
jgi:N-acetylglucosamine kinase-like BadF-type ATPase